MLSWLLSTHFTPNCHWARISLARGNMLSISAAHPSPMAAWSEKGRFQYFSHYLCEHLAFRSFAQSFSSFWMRQLVLTEWHSSTVLVLFVFVWLALNKLQGKIIVWPGTENKHGPCNSVRFASSFSLLCLSCGQELVVPAVCIYFFVVDSFWANTWCYTWCYVWNWAFDT